MILVTKTSDQRDRGDRMNVYMCVYVCMHIFYNVSIYLYVWDIYTEVPARLAQEILTREKRENTIFQVEISDGVHAIKRKEAGQSSGESRNTTHEKTKYALSK